jgi:hypothetical protein
MKLKTLVCLSLITPVASLYPATQAQTFSVIHTFEGQSGATPDSGVTIRAGVLYGTTLSTRYNSGAGTVYQISHMGSSWVHTPISLFSGGQSIRTYSDRARSGIDLARRPGLKQLLPQ